MTVMMLSYCLTDCWVDRATENLKPSQSIAQLSQTANFEVFLGVNKPTFDLYDQTQFFAQCPAPKQHR